MIQVSVIIPVFNIEAHLQQCLDSVINQTLSDIEIICVDDGSTDTSPQILSKYAERDKRFRIITQENSGPGIARNTGLEQAKGKYVIFLDSDDWFELDFLEQVVNKAVEANADVTICQTVEFDSDTGKPRSAKWMLKRQFLPADVFSPEDIQKYLFQFTYGMPWDKLYRLEYLKKTGILFPSLRNSEDLAFVFPTLLESKRIAIQPNILIHHRINLKSSVSNNLANQPEAPYIAFEIVKKWLDDANKMDFYKQSFLNWSMEFLIWHVCNINDIKIQKMYFKHLKSIWFETLDLSSYPCKYFFRKSLYLKYLLVKNAPFWLFKLVHMIYKSVLKIL